MNTELEELETDIAKELVAIIGNVVVGKKSSTIKDIQPPVSIIDAMATAAAQVLISFERGYRMDR